LIVYVTVEVMFCMHFVPEILLARTSTSWLKPLVPALRGALTVIWPLRAALDLAISVGRISEEELPPGTQAQQDGIEALVEAAQEGGMLAGDKAQLIEQVVEFSDKRVLEVMTPRPDIVAIPANATIEQMRRLLVETKFSRLMVYQQTLDDVVGIAHVQDLLQIPENEAKHRTVRELARPALFVPETKLGSDLLKEMRRRNQQMAIVIDEHGMVAGVVTVEDLVEEIVGEMGKEMIIWRRTSCGRRTEAWFCEGAFPWRSCKSYSGSSLLTNRIRRRPPLQGWSITLRAMSLAQASSSITRGCTSKWSKPTSERCCACASGLGFSRCPSRKLPQLTSRAKPNAAAAAIPPVTTV